MKPPEEQAEKPKINASSTATGLTLLMNDDQGRPLYAVTSARSTQSMAQKNATLTDTHVTLYHEGKPNMYVAAPQAKVDAEHKVLHMWGGLKARAPQQDTTFRVDTMTWSADTRVFQGTGHVKCTRGNIVMTAKQLSGRTPVKRLSLDGDVRIVVTP